MPSDLVALASQWGAPGLMLAFMVWDRTETRKEREKQEKRRGEQIEAQTLAGLEQARAMTLLAERIKP